MEESKKKVVVGGTFDLFHKGHKALINRALEIGDLYLGLTSDNMAKEMKRRDVESFQDRKKNLIDYLVNDLKKDLEVIEIEDKFGFAINEDLDCIVVSSETEHNAFLINEQREMLGKKPLEIVRVELVLADDKKPISSTRIHNKEITKDGEILK